MKNTLIPTHCPSCQQPVKVDGLHLVCSNKQCPDQVVFTILHWIESRKMDGVAESTVRSLYESGKIKSIIDLYSLTAKSLSGLAGFGDSKISNLLAELERTKEMTIGQCCDGIGMPLIGEKAIAKMGIKSVDDMWEFDNKSSVIGQNLISYLKSNKKFVEELLSVVKIKSPKNVSKNAKNVAMTGSYNKPRKQLEDDIAARGDVFHSSVSKDTDLLLVEDPNSGSSKIQKATKMGVKIMSYDDYFGR